MSKPEVVKRVTSSFYMFQCTCSLLQGQQQRKKVCSIRSCMPLLAIAAFAWLDYSYIIHESAVLRAKEDNFLQLSELYESHVYQNNMKQQSML